MKVQKTTLVEARQWTGDNLDEMFEFTEYNFATLPEDFDGNDAEVYDALHATWVPFRAGDYVMRGDAGEFYPVRRDVFESTYKIVEESKMSDNTQVPAERKSRASKVATMKLVVIDGDGELVTVDELIEFARQLKDAKIPGNTVVKAFNDTSDDSAFLQVEYDPTGIPGKRFGFGRSR